MSENANRAGRRPLILVTNDDGIESPGLHAVAEAAVAAAKGANGAGEVIVAAPTNQQTARGRSMNGNERDHFHPYEIPETNTDNRRLTAWHIDASPALVCQHALTVLCDGRTPDLVVSGINYGENIGTDIGGSGTLGAAFQAAAQGIPALALSRQTGVENHFFHGHLDWSETIRVAERWIRKILDLAPSLAAQPPGRRPFDVLKVDIPDPCPNETPERLTRLSMSRYLGFHIEKPSSRTRLGESRTYIAADAHSLDPADDGYAVAVDRVIAVTPLTIDCTASMIEAQRVLQV
ncbi:5'-nucleotidase /3'-nucleotidase /exopolyphosphatase [Alkalispirochaeta americana]|uniref:5'-nucleotidase n=1 Tax=Alkalispirochaeta americana TaxID=159291 RepID=A0A1N6VWQ8_9SPIO|nr:5'/3'-nucleotidase SurE [Alkalispirochaeta americana]SIQ82313.1 5'-nucleotidase /3'-nucleotidase /exopolyphosphatase [Alkalispirochaeta americana]